MFVATAIACATLPGTVELGLLTLGAFAPRRKPRAEGERSIRQIAIVIPAHDEEKTIGSAVASLLACDRTSCAISIHVIADNCTDDTAGAAVRAGARLIERHDTERRGKGHALAYAFERVLEDESVDAILVIDADSRVDANFLSECEAAFARGSHAIQAGYQIGNPEASDRVRLVAIAFRAFNVLRPRARSRLGLSCGILGNGFGLARATVERVPYTARSVVEDLEYHLELVKAGLRVDFLEGTTVRADQPLGDAAEKTQRARWEGGRFRMIREHAPKLLAEVVRGRLGLAEPLGELLLLPLGLHTGALATLLVLPFPPTQIYAACGLGLVGAHVLAAELMGGASVADLVALAKAPAYVAWKLRVLPKVLGASRKSQEWVRTAREPSAAAGQDA
jgi:cellulose synthase/poly-beta-1,6-N-acetylglucosamine synthase-like glycosyltransferase